MAIDMTGEMQELIDNALAERFPCIVGTASADGEPQISMKGSVIVYDAGTLAYWERAKRIAIQNVQANPKVVIFYRNPEKRINWRFHGTATVYEHGGIRDAAMSRTVHGELDRDPERHGVSVRLRLDRLTELSRNLLQQRD